MTAAGAERRMAMGRLVLLVLGVAVGVAAGVFISARATRTADSDGDAP